MSANAETSVAPERQAEVSRVCQVDAGPPPATTVSLLAVALRRLLPDNHGAG